MKPKDVHAQEPLVLTLSSGNSHIWIST